MSAISVIGLGAMGSALARALRNGSIDVTAWNRTAARIAPLVEAGARGAESLAAAVEASPIILVCVQDYVVTRDLFGASAIAPRLHGKTMIQLSTGTPREARKAEAWFGKLGASYIDGAIMRYPTGIGTPTTKILFAGPNTAYKACLPTISPLGGGLTYVGPNIGAAATLDLAFLSAYLGMVAGVIHGCRACHAEGVAIEEYAAELTDPYAVDLAQLIQGGNFSDPGCAIDVWSYAVERIGTQASDAGIRHDFPDFLMSLLQRAKAAGLGSKDIAAVYETL
jgi:3-hydroxyisobutyrate dehydrogenase-like beta-hydroxyacid dehydrogenase